MKKIPLLVCACVCFCTVLFSQEVTSRERVRPVNQSTLMGIGKVFLDDSYLSPLTYDGVAISLIHDRVNKFPLFEGDMLLQNQFRIQTGVTKNPTSSASEYWGSIYYTLNGLYLLFKPNNFRLYAGGGPEVALGGIYNVRNSNNPGSLKSSFNLNLSSMMMYNWKSLTFRWQVSTPFAGLFFSPEYGHSYYEIFTLGNNKGTIHFGSFHNQLALRNYFTVDIPVSNVTFRTGYLWDYYMTDVNQLTTRINSHQFVIGLAFESLNFGGKKSRDNPVFKSAYY